MKVIPLLVNAIVGSVFILLVNYYRLARDESALSRLALLLHYSTCPFFLSSAWGAPLGGAGTLPKSL